MRVLLVDDDPDFLESARRAGARSSHSIRTSLIADEALRLLEQEGLDAVLADYRLPPEDGAELLRRVREARPAVKRVLVSDFSRDYFARRGFEMGLVDLFVTKDEVLRDIDTKLTALLGPGPANP